MIQDFYISSLWWSWWWWWWSPACRVAKSGRSGRYICAILSQLVTRVFIEKRVFYDQTDHDRFSCQSFRTKFASVLIKSLFASLPACPQNARILFIWFNIILFCFFLLYATLSFIICLYPHLTDWPLALMAEINHWRAKFLKKLQGSLAGYLGVVWQMGKWAKWKLGETWSELGGGG